MKRQYPEAELQRAVAQFLSAVLDPERAMFRMVENNPRSRIAGAMAKARGVRAGTPDVLIWWRAPMPIRAQSVVHVHACHFGAVELKSARGRQTLEQAEFQRAFESIGGHYALCRDVDAVELALAMWGMPMRGRFR
jgi:hypothetical protein